jgi:succinate-semialdehyde dehydrogenase / glutarate-semialdehyde dehydrogenase
MTTTDIESVQTDADFPRIQMYIAGRWTDGTSGRTEPLVDPATERTLGEVPLASIADLDEALAAADAGFRTWSRTPISERTELLHRAADLMVEHSAEIGRMMTLEEARLSPRRAGRRRGSPPHCGGTPRTRGARTEG